MVDMRDPGTLTDEHVHDAATVVARQLGYEAMKYEQLEVVLVFYKGTMCLPFCPLASARVFALRAFHRSTTDFYHACSRLLL